MLVHENSYPYKRGKGMKRTLTPFYLYVSLIFSVLSSRECRADIAIIAGAGSATVGCDSPDYPIAQSLSIGANFAPSITMPTNAAGIISVAIGQRTGNIVFAGINEDTYLPLIYSGSILSSSVNVISLPDNSAQGFLICSAIDSEGTAILGGRSEGDIYTPIGYRLLLGATEATSISFPDVDSGEIQSLAIAPNNTAIFVGKNFSTLNPMIYILPEGSSTAISLPIPDTSITGILECVAISPDGKTAILAGQDTLNNQSLIYRLSLESNSISSISIPSTGDGSFINTVAFAADGSAILGGGNNSESVIYRVLAGSNSASTITHPNEDDGGGTISGAAIGSDGVAILAGFTYNFPLIYRIAPGESQATSVTIPDLMEGELISVSIGNDNIAVLVGGSYNSNGFIYTVSTTDTTASNISFSTLFPDEVFLSVAIYSSNVLYDTRRLIPYYYNQIEETKNALKKARIQ